LFFQFDWKLRSNLTVNLGVRWEDYTPLRDKDLQLSNIDFPSGGGLQGAKIEPTWMVNRNGHLYDSDRNNFGPRFGFAYSPGIFRTRLVVRGGFGVFYNRLPEQVFDSTRQNPPFTADYGNCCGTSTDPDDGGLIQYTLGSSNSPTSYPVNPKLATGIDPNTGTPPGQSVQVYGALPSTPNSYVEEGSLGVEYSLPRGWLAAVTGEISGGHKIDRLVNPNYLYVQPTYPNPLSPGSTYQPFANGIFVMLPDVNSAYDALDTRLSHQFNQAFLRNSPIAIARALTKAPGKGPVPVPMKPIRRTCSRSAGRLTSMSPTTSLLSLSIKRRGSRTGTACSAGW
jgi:hypothetical protein